MPTLIFSTRFHAAVESGEKRQTIRPTRKRPIRIGDPLSLRAWTGAPYRSPQRELRSSICIDVTPFIITEDFTDNEEAIRDGFEDAVEMKAWFRNVHGLPFTGDRIRWA